MSSPERESLRDLAAAYALGALDADELSRFELFLATSPETQQDVAEFRNVAGLLALGEPQRAVGPGLRDRVLARVSEEGSGRRRIPIAVWGALAASLVAIVGLGGALLSLRGDVARLNQGLGVERERLEAREATLDALLEPGVELYRLSARGDPEPGIQLFWNRKRNSAIVNGFGLKPLPPGKAYQLWFMRDGKPVPSVTFSPDATGQVRVERVPVPTGGKVSAAAVTVEPAGGSPQPTSSILLLGKLG